MRQLLTAEHLQHIFADIEAAKKAGEAKIWAVKINSPVWRIRIVGQIIQAAERLQLIAREVSLVGQPNIFQQIEKDLSKPPHRLDCVVINAYADSSKDAPSEEYLCQLLELFARQAHQYSYVFVFCLPTFLLNLAYRNAPNFWRSIRSRLIDLKSDLEPPKELEYGFSSAPVEPAEARAKRVQLLESQIAEIRQRYKATPQDQIPTMLLLAQAYLDDRQYEKAFEVYSDLLLLLSTPDDLTHRALALYRLGAILHIWGYYEKSLQHYRDSLALYIKIGDLEHIAELLHQIGLLYQDLGEFDKAIDYYSRSLSHNRELKNSDASAGTRLNLGTVYEDIGLHVKAIEHYREAFESFKQNNNLRGMGVSLLYAGQVYEERGLHKEALKYYLAAQSILDKTTSIYRTTVRKHLGNLEHTLGKEQYDKLVQSIFSAKKNPAASSPTS
ncbi:MAG: tetratricopeptide repeat protein [Chloroherpetonaceae bacterium]|nr:tetratricopeptide repeat protein [Chloroherpetonaceae bacterium]